MNVLMTGGNSKFGAVLAEEMLERGWNVERIHRAWLDNIGNYNFKDEYDVVFFNHNRPIINFQLDTVSVQILKRIDVKRVGWMITNAALYPEQFEAPNPQFWSYVAQKMLYINQMKYFQNSYSTFCFDPGIITDDNKYSIAIELMNAFVEPTMKIYKSVSGSGLYGS